jgi:hypothetical protein
LQRRHNGRPCPKHHTCHEIYNSDVDEFYRQRKHSYGHRRSDQRESKNVTSTWKKGESSKHARRLDDQEGNVHYDQQNPHHSNQVDLNGSGLLVVTFDEDCEEGIILSLERVYKVERAAS